MAKSKQVVGGTIVEVDEKEEVETESSKEESNQSEEVSEETSEGKKPEVSEEEETEEGVAKPFWLEDEEEEEPSKDDEEEESGSVPVASHIKLKQKLKGSLKEKDEELERLREENARLKQSRSVERPKPKRPKFGDFDSQSDFDEALDKYEEELTKYNADVLQQTAEEQNKQKQLQQKIEQAVDDHYTRAEKLVKEVDIKPEVFQQADVRVKKALDEIIPDKGEDVFNYLVSTVGEGSEKAMLYIGRNNKALKEFSNSFKEDPTGLATMLYLGRVTERIKNSQTKNSRAPKPASNLNTGSSSPSAASLKKKYAEAHKKGNASEAYRIKKDAKAQGIDTKTW